MTITHLAHDATNNIHTGSGNQVTVTITAPASGNVLIVAVGMDSITSAVPTVTSVTCTNVQFIKGGGYAGTQYFACEIWFGYASASAGTSLVVTGSATNFDIMIVNSCEFSGLPTGSFLDQATGQRGANSPATTGNVITTVASELLIGAVNNYCGGATSAQSSSNPNSPTYLFTMYNGADVASTYDSAHLSLALLWQIVRSTGTYNTGTTFAAGTWQAAIATFKGYSENNSYSHTFANNMGGKQTLSEHFASRIRSWANNMGGLQTLTGHAHNVVITGVTRSANSAILGSVTVYLYRTSDNALIGSTTSDVSTGVYTFSNVPYDNYYLVGMKKGSPDVFGTTDNNIT